MIIVIFVVLFQQRLISLSFSPLLLKVAPERADVDLSETNLQVSESELAASEAASSSSWTSEEPGDAAASSSKASSAKVKSNPNAQYAVPALSLLGEMLAGLLDVIYSSEEKERVLPLLYTVMTNVTPYLKNHSK